MSVSDQKSLPSKVTADDDLAWLARDPASTHDEAVAAEKEAARAKS